MTAPQIAGNSSSQSLALRNLALYVCQALSRRHLADDSLCEPRQMHGT